MINRKVLMEFGEGDILVQCYASFEDDTTKGNVHFSNAGWHVLCDKKLEDIPLAGNPDVAMKFNNVESLDGLIRMLKMLRDEMVPKKKRSKK